jgi:predicted HNH restriction endonuclease
MKTAVVKRRKKLKDMAIEYGGGKCQVCGYDRCKRALSFHHKEPSQKDFGLSSRGLTRSWEKTKIEIDKCILVCANCHMEIHEGMVNI